MKKIFSVTIFIILLQACTSVAEFNKKIETPVAPELLQKDVDFAYEKLDKYHPNLYWFISKEQLKKQFDSVKNSIRKPLKPNEFYYLLAPVIANVKEGHLRLRPLQKKLTQTEREKYKKLKSLYGRFEYKIFDHQLFISKNKDSIQKIPVGAQILKIDQIPVADLLKKYQPLIASDGENTTYHKYGLARLFFGLYGLDHGLKDETEFEILHQNEVKKYIIKRDTLEKYNHKKSAKSIEKKKTEKKEKRKHTETEKKKKDSIDQLKKEENSTRYMKFLGKDSTTAYLRIKRFEGFSKKFYKREFEKIAKAKTKNLIIDLRENPGGSLNEIRNLYGYLSKNQYQFIKKPEINFNRANLSRNYFYGKNVFSKIVLAPFYPSFIIANYAAAKKGENGKYYMNEKAAKTNPLKENNFAGKIYVLIDGGSFSASSIIAAKLKGDQRAILVGEETGGNNDGTVAGFYNTVTLPHSKLTLPISLMLIQPNIDFENKNKGVSPHIEIPPNAVDFLSGKDAALEWILNDIKK